MYSRLTPEGRFVSLLLCKIFGWIGAIILGLWALVAAGNGISKYNASMDQVSYVPPARVCQPRRFIRTADLPPVNIPSPINIPPSVNMFATSGPTPVASAPAPEPTDSGANGQEIQLPKIPVRRDVPKVGRNDPCPCGSGKKFKHCHGA